MTIRNRMITIFICIFVLMLIMGGATVFILNRIRDQEEETHWLMDQILFFAEREIDHRIWLNDLGVSLMYGEPFTGQLDHTKCKVGSWYYEFIESPDFEKLSPELQKKYLELEWPHEQVHRSARQITAMIESGGEYSLEAARTVYHYDTRGFTETLADIFKDIKELHEQEEQAVLAQMEQQRKVFVGILYGIVAVCALIVLLALFSISRTVLAPLDDITKRAKIIAQGDFTQKVAVRGGSRDEVSQLGMAFNQLIDGISALLQRAAQSADGVRSLSANLSEATESLSSSIQDVAGSTNQIAASSQELSGSSQEMASNSQKVAEKARAGEEEMKGALNAMRSIQRKTEELQLAVRKLGDRSAEIGKIVQAINSIAEQTDLLALNAAIEAARAGEQGRGFAVVAEEVRKLAEQSAHAAQEIAEIIATTQHDSDRVVEGMKENIQQVDEGMRAMEETAGSFHEIVEAVEGLMSRVESVAAAAEELSASSQEVAAATQEQSAVVEEISSSSAEQDAISQKLHEVISKFKLSEEGAGAAEGEGRLEGQPLENNLRAASEAQEDLLPEEESEGEGNEGGESEDFEKLFLEEEEEGTSAE